jgi:hypothetical protein
MNNATKASTIFFIIVVLDCSAIKCKVIIELTHLVFLLIRNEAAAGAWLKG